MSTSPLTGVHSRAQSASATGVQAPVLDWAMTVLSFWFVGGLCLDGWAHAHGKVDQSFFTPWHAVFYSGFAAVALLIGAATLRGVMRGTPWYAALPPSYSLALLGLPLFALGGLGDLAWHEVFGIERGIEALLSPTHLVLIASMLLIVSAPLRGALASGGAQSSRLPALLSLALALTLITFITEYAHPFIEPMANEARNSSDGAKLGVAAIMLQSGILAGILLMALRLPRLRPGAFTLVFGVNAAMISVLNDQFWTIAVAVAGGIAADALYAALRLPSGPAWARRVFLAAVPAVTYLAYFGVLMKVDGVLWRLHMWLGAVFLAAAVGLLLAIVAQSPLSERSS